MKKPVLVVVAITLAWYAYSRYHSDSARYSEDPSARGPALATDRLVGSETSAKAFTCDGRTHCSQMKSCAEATYFLRNCPGVEMDGDGDGVPCESQWCGRE